MACGIPSCSMGQHFAGTGDANAAGVAETVIQSPVISCRRRAPGSEWSERRCVG